MASPSEWVMKKCVLHVEPKGITDPEIILFQESTLKMCQEAKFKTITLPLIPNEILGYHSRCYKNYTAVSAQQKLESAQNVNEEQAQSTSSQELFMAVPTGISNNTFIIIWFECGHSYDYIFSTKLSIGGENNGRLNKIINRW